jgi:hypothetical protein
MKKVIFMLLALCASMAQAEGRLDYEDHKHEGYLIYKCPSNDIKKVLINLDKGVMFIYPSGKLHPLITWIENPMLGRNVVAIQTPDNNNPVPRQHYFDMLSAVFHINYGDSVLNTYHLYCKQELRGIK